MEVKFTDKEKKRLDATIEESKVRRWLIARENMKFSIGDVLVMSKKHYKGEWKYETVSYENKMPQRFVYVYEDEYGIGFIRQLRVSDGKLGEVIMSLTDFDYGNTRFEVDPEYAERQFLGAEFNIKDVHKQSLEERKLVIKANRKIGTKLNKTLSSANEFIKTLKVGDTFWKTNDYTGKWIVECTVLKTSSKKIESYGRPWRLDDIKKKNSSYEDTNIIYSVDYNSKNQWGLSKDSTNSLDLYNYIVYKTKPATVDKNET